MTSFICYVCISSEYYKLLVKLCVYITLLSHFLPMTCNSAHYKFVVITCRIRLFHAVPINGAVLSQYLYCHSSLGYNKPAKKHSRILKLSLTQIPLNTQDDCHKGVLPSFPARWSLVCQCPRNKREYTWGSWCYWWVHASTKLSCFDWEGVVHILHNNI